MAVMYKVTVYLMGRTGPIQKLCIRTQMSSSRRYLSCIQAAPETKMYTSRQGRVPPLPCHPPSYWLKLFSSQTFSRMNTPIFSNLIILHTYPPMKMEQSVPERRDIKFRRRRITQKKANNL